MIYGRITRSTLSFTETGVNMRALSVSLRNKRTHRRTASARCSRRRSTTGACPTQIARGGRGRSSAARGDDPKAVDPGKDARREAVDVPHLDRPDRRQELLEHDASLEPGQRCSDAEVPAEAEAEVRIR